MSQSLQRQSTDERSLSDDMFAVDRHTLENGLVRGEITELTTGEDTIQITVKALTTGESAQFEFERPETWTTSNRFVRLVEWCGYNAASSEQIVGEEVPLNSADSGWEISITRLPGEGILENKDYYKGVSRGFIATVVWLASTGWVVTVLAGAGLGIIAPVLSAVFSLLAPALILHFFILLRPDDCRERMSWSEVAGGEFSDE